MLWAIAVILMAVWLLGLVTGTTAGGFIHVLPVIAFVVVVVNLIQGRKSGYRATRPSHRGFAYQGILFKAKGSQSHPPRPTRE